MNSCIRSVAKRSKNAFKNHPSTSILELALARISDRDGLSKDATNTSFDFDCFSGTPRGLAIVRAGERSGLRGEEKRNMPITHEVLNR